jgi:cytochrome c oxidase subunit 1
MNVWISVLLFVGTAAQFIFLFNLAWSLIRGRRAEANPWEGASLEWTTPSPAPFHNWAELPVVYRGPYEYRTNGAAEPYLPQTRAQVHP